jgi:hypothetical protein
LRYYADAYADHYGIPRTLVHAVIAQESNWNPRALSTKGAAGLMQLMPATARMYFVRNRFSITENLSGGFNTSRISWQSFAGKCASLSPHITAVHGESLDKDCITEILMSCPTSKRYAAGISLSCTSKQTGIFQRRGEDSDMYSIRTIGFISVLAGAVLSQAQQLTTATATPGDLKPTVSDLAMPRTCFSGSN